MNDKDMQLIQEQVGTWFQTRQSDYSCHDFMPLEYRLDPECNTVTHVRGLIVRGTSMASVDVPWVIAVKWVRDAKALEDAVEADRLHRAGQG